MSDTLKRYTVKCKKTGKYIKNNDQTHITKPEYWTGTFDQARIYKNLGHLKASVSVREPDKITYLPDGRCRACGKQRDVSHKRCHECGGLLGGQIKTKGDLVVPDTIEVVELKLSIIED